MKGYLPDTGENTAYIGTWGWSFQILPFIEQQNLYQRVYNVAMANGGQVTSGNDGGGWPVPIKTYLDPARNHFPYGVNGKGSSPGVGGPHTDYAINGRSFGYSQTNNPAGMGGTPPCPYINAARRTMSQLTSANGTANTILVGEKAMDSNFAATNQQSSGWDEDIFSGGYGGQGRWSYYPILVKDYHGTNPITGTSNNNNYWGSPYDGGSPFLMCDGSVRLINYTYNNTFALGAAMTWYNNKPFTLD